jgi:hypothetical protein
MLPTRPLQCDWTRVRVVLRLLSGTLRLRTWDRVGSDEANVDASNVMSQRKWLEPKKDDVVDEPNT